MSRAAARPGVACPWCAWLPGNPNEPRDHPREIRACVNGSHNTPGLQQSMLWARSNPDQLGEVRRADERRAASEMSVSERDLERYRVSKLEDALGAIEDIVQRCPHGCGDAVRAIRLGVKA